MSAAYDFTGLTPAQQRLLTFNGWAPRDGHKQPRPATAQALVKRGLLVEREVVIGAARIKAYDVPPAVHMAWCEWCSEHQKGSRE